VIDRSAQVRGRSVGVIEAAPDLAAARTSKVIADVFDVSSPQPPVMSEYHAAAAVLRAGVEQARGDVPLAAIERVEVVRDASGPLLKVTADLRYRPASGGTVEQVVGQLVGAGGHGPSVRYEIVPQAAKPPPGWEGRMRDSYLEKANSTGFGDDELAKRMPSAVQAAVSAYGEPDNTYAYGIRIEGRLTYGVHWEGPNFAGHLTVFDGDGHRLARAERVDGELTFRWL
jgi:hypothetical protein